MEPEESDVALLMLSSGSTGPPKAVRITHRGLADFAASSRPMALGMRPGHTTVNWLPVDHSGAFLLYHLLPVFTGCTNVHAPTDHVLAEPLRWLDLLDEHSARHSWAPTFAYQLITDALAGHPSRRWDLAGVRSLVCGGEHLSLPVLRRFLEATAPFGLGGPLLVPVWGMAETVTGVTYGRLDRPGPCTACSRAASTATWSPAGDQCRSTTASPLWRPAHPRTASPCASWTTDGCCPAGTQDRAAPGVFGRPAHTGLRQQPGSGRGGLPRRDGTGSTRATSPFSTRANWSSRAGART